MKFVFGIGLLLVLAATCNTKEVRKSGRILLIPFQVNSHLRMFESLGTEMIKRGHDVYMVVSTACKLPKYFQNTKVKLMFYKSPNDHLEWDTDSFQKNYVFTNIFDPARMWLVNSNWTSLIVEEGEFFLKDKNIYETAVNKSFDVAVLSGDHACRFNYVFPYKLGIPYVSVVIAVDSYTAGIPVLPSFMPSIITTNTEDMNFRQRLSNLFEEIMLSMYEPPALKDTIVRKLAKGWPFRTLRQLSRDSAAWLINMDYLMDYHRPSMPHTSYVGGLTTQPGKPLQPPLLKTFVDNAKQGVIIVSFGSWAPHVPEPVTSKLFQAFSNVSHKIVWGYNGRLPEQLPPHIKIIRWLPQNDLLAHPNVKLFITHCGANSQYEALYHGVPMLNFPMTSEQHYNAARSQYKGYSLTLELRHFKPADVVHAINELIDNPKYEHAIQNASVIFRDRPHTPEQRGAIMVEHVMKYGGKHLRCNAIEMNWVEYYMIDVIAFAIFIFAVVAYLIKSTMGPLIVTLISFKMAHHEESESNAAGGPGHGKKNR